MEFVEILRNSLEGRSLGSSLKIDLGEYGALLLEGSEVVRGDGEAETTLTTSVDVLADIYTGHTDAVQALYNGMASIVGSQSATLRLSELLDSRDGPTNRVGRFGRSDSVGAIAASLDWGGAVVIEAYIGSCTGIEIFPGETAQVLHTDAGIYPIHLPGMELQVSAMWALTDFTIENGATHVRTGSHHGPPRSHDRC